MWAYAGVFFLQEASLVLARYAMGMALEAHNNLPPPGVEGGVNDSVSLRDK